MSAWESPRVEEHPLGSRFVAQEYRIQVWLPHRRADERFPAVYALDSDLFFGGYRDLSHTLQLLGEVPRFILVGIGYPNRQEAELLRTRDLYPREIRELYRQNIEQLTRSELNRTGIGSRTLLQTTDAIDFFSFIRLELMPWLQTRFPVEPAEATLVGYSAGGAFGLHALFSQPEAFRRYILGSAALSYAGHQFGIQLAERFRASQRHLTADLFLSVGEDEESTPGFAQFELMPGFHRFVSHLITAPIAGLSFQHEILRGETHATAWAAGFSRGLRALLQAVPPPDFLPAYLRRG